MANSNENKNAGWNFSNSYETLPNSLYSKIKPNSVQSPKIVVLNEQLVDFLGLNIEALHTENEVLVLAGNRIPEDGSAIAQAYAGHQFGHFAKLGDGRALLIGEQITPDGKRFDIQLKGSGRTPYSRGGDGRAALGPMLREYIISEAMNSLGIPTTRSLSVVTTGETILRETPLPGAIMTRVAASHLRVGTFEYAAHFCTFEELKSLADYAINRHYPGIADKEDKYLHLLKEVIKRQASLITKWQLVGFIHGVMNTDNMTISGETIDYGPCAFMDTYDPATVFSSIDVQGRYAYGNQPRIGGWNLARFAEAILPLLNEEQEKAVEIAQEAIYSFTDLYHSNWYNGMRSKLGLFNSEEKDEELITELLQLMTNYKADYTNTFRSLTLGILEEQDLFLSNDFKEWHKKWDERRKGQSESKEASDSLMRNNNPSVIPRNHFVEEALEAAIENNDYKVMDRLLSALLNPYAYSDEQEKYTKQPPSSSAPYRTYCGT